MTTENMNYNDNIGFKYGKETDNTKFSFTNFSKKFDEHINSSIRGYSTLRDDVVSISKYFVEDDTYVLDLGCSEGTLLRSMCEQNDHTETSQFIGVDVNESFQQHWNDTNRIRYVVDDITTMEFPKDCSFISSLFTFQFISERQRTPLLKKIYNSLVEGGGFVISEKLNSNFGKFQNMMDFLYYDFKKNNFSEKQILDKEIELRHLSKLTDENRFIHQLRNCGFNEIQTFWRNFNFVGLICLKLPNSEFGGSV